MPLRNVRKPSNFRALIQSFVFGSYVWMTVGEIISGRELLAMLFLGCSILTAFLIVENQENAKRYGMSRALHPTEEAKK